MTRKRMCDFFAAITVAGVLYSGCLTQADAQNVTCATRALGDNSNACASTAFVHNEIAGNIPLLAGYIFVGNSSNIATGVLPSGDWTITTAGVNTVAKVNGVSYPSGPSTNTLPIITGANTATYQQIFDAQVSASAAISAAKLSFTATGAPQARTVQSKLADVNLVNMTDYYLTADGTNYALAIQRANDSAECASGCVINITSSGNIATQVNITHSYVTLRGLVQGAGTVLQAPVLNVTYAAGPAFVFGDTVSALHSMAIENIAFTQDAAVSQAMFYVQNVRGFTFRSSNANSVYKGFIWGNSAATPGTYIMNLLGSSISIRGTGTHCIEIPDGFGALYTEDFECYGPNTAGSYGIWFKSGNTRPRFDEVVLGRRTFFQFFDKAIFQDNTRVGNVTIADGRYDFNITCFLCTDNTTPDATGGGFGSAVIVGNQINSRPWVATGTGAAITDVSFVGNKITTDNSLFLSVGAGAQTSTNLNFTGNIFNLTPTIANIPAIYLTGTFNGLGFGANTFYTSGATPGQYTIDFSATFTGGGYVSVSPQGAYGFTAGGQAIHNNPNPLATTGGSNGQVQYNNAGALGGSVNLTWLSPTLSIGNAGITSGQLSLGASAGGAVNINPFAAVTFNYNLPTTAGTAGQPQLSGGGGAAPMTWGTVSGSGNFAMTTNPVFTTPTLGAASATSINKVAITAPATSSTLTVADGKTLTSSNTLTFTGTDGSSVAFGAGGTVAYGANKSSFSVHKNGTDQTGVADNTATQVTFGTEVYDVGNNFATDTWTPPAGKIQIVGSVLATGTLPAGGFCTVSVYKNGSAFKSGSFPSAPTGCVMAIGMQDSANGTDAYTIFVTVDTTGGTSTINGNSANTYLMGSYLN